MDHWDMEFEQTLADSEALLKNAARSMDDGTDYSLDSILAEFGGSAPAEDAPKSAEQTLLEDAQEDRPAPPDGMTAPDTAEASPDTAAEPPESMSLQDVLAQTVQTVLNEQAHEPILPEQEPRRGLFSRKKLQETEELYTRTDADTADGDEDEPEPPERPIAETLSHHRTRLAALRRVCRALSILGAVMWAALLLDFFGVMPQVYTDDPLLHALPHLVLEVLACVIARGVFVSAWNKLREKTISYELLASLLCLVTLCDTALYLLSDARHAGSTPFHALAVLTLLAASLGQYFYERGMYDTFRVAAIGAPPYMVTVTAGGAAKRSGQTLGFSNCAAREDPASRAQRVLLPVILTAALVFSVLSTLEVRTFRLFFWNFSALLCGAGTLALPLVYGYPLKKIAKRLTKSGSAVAGFAGADAIRASNCMILTDNDVFPPGTITLNGLKVFGEESGKVISYAATMAHASDCGLSRLFDNLLLSDGGHLQPLDELSFYEEGGMSGTIHGETVLFGTLPFFRKKGITLPRDIKLQTGVFLAVDGVLVAVFAVKYMAAENVDWAIHALHRMGITPVLAVRDANITPALLKRKFGTDARAVFPKLSTRLALSERSGGSPCALLFREGLMPYAEVTLGSKRLCRAVKTGSRLSLLGSIAGTLLSFYLTFSQAYSTLTPVSMLAFSALWTLAALLDAVFVDRY